MPRGGDRREDVAFLHMLRVVAVAQPDKGVDPGAVVRVVPTGNCLPQTDPVDEVEHTVALFLGVGAGDVESDGVGEVVPVLLTDVSLNCSTPAVDLLLVVVGGEPSGTGPAFREVEMGLG